MKPVSTRSSRHSTTRHRQTAAVIRDPLELIGVAPAAARILRYFVLRPHATPHMRYLQLLLGLGGASIQRDLGRLVTIGALERFEDGRLVRYRVAADSSLWTAFRIMVGATRDPVSLVRDALSDVHGVKAAFVYGSTAANIRRQDSDVDLFVMEDPTVDRRALHAQLAEVGTLMRCEVNAVRYTPQALAERLGDAKHASGRFVREVLTGPKQWVAGGDAELRSLATAAGIRMPNVPKHAT